MFKKSQAKIVIFIICFIIVSITISGIYLYFKSSKIEVEESPEEIELYLRSIDLVTEDYVNSEYMLLSNISTYSTGELSKDSYKPLNVPLDRAYNLYCWSDKYYLSKEELLFSSEELSLKKSKINCAMNKIGSLEIEHKGDISRHLNVVRFNITSRNGSFKKMGFCVKWSTGVIKVVNENKVLKCPYGSWKNWSSYNITNKSYIYLDDGFYRCADEGIEECEWVMNNKCYIKDIEVLPKLRLTYDSCSYLGISLNENESTELVLDIETTGNMNDLDFIELLFWDKDQRYINKNFEYVTQHLDVNIGAEDIRYKIDYGG